MPCRGCWRCPAHVARAAGRRSASPSRRRGAVAVVVARPCGGRPASQAIRARHAHGACLRTEEERRGFRRTDEEALRLPKARRAIGRGEPLGGDRRHGRPEARRPQRGEPPARGQAGRNRWRAASGRGRGTGRGPAGRRGHGRGRRGRPHGPQGGRGVGERPRPRQRAGLLPGQGQRPRHVGRRRRGPEQGGGRRRKARPGRTRRLPGRSRVAGVGQRDAGRQEERRPLPWPAGDPGSSSALGGHGRRHDRRAHPCRDRGPQGHGEGPPSRRGAGGHPRARRGRCPRAAGRGDTGGAGGPSGPPDRGGSGQGACLGLVSGRGRTGRAPLRCTVSPSATHR